MPLITINAPMTVGEERIKSTIDDVRRSAAASIQTPLSNVWVMFQPLLKNHFLPNGNEEQDSYIPIVIVKAKAGRTPAEKSSLALAVTGAVGRGLSIPNERVWLQYEEMNPADIWFGDTLGAVMI